MYTTPYADVNEVVQAMLLRLQHVLNTNLIGVYLYGSLVTGDFDRDISDIDLLVVVTHPVDQNTLHHLRAMHAAVALELARR
jgi:predicted nucleotidyltransferase